MVSWPEEKVSQLIELYRVYPELWDTKNRDYKNRNKKNDALKTISEVMEVEIMEIERKINVLLAQYRKNRNKVLSLRERGIDSTDIERNIWYGYKQMSFLEDRYNVPPVPRSTDVKVENNVNHEENSEDVEGERNYSYATEETDNTGDYWEDKLQVCLTEVNDGVSEHSPSVRTEERSRNLKRRRGLRRRQLNQAGRCCHVEQMMDFMKYLIGNRDQAVRDEYALYGEQIAIKLRKFDETSRAETQYRINCLLHEAELKMIQQRQETKRKREQ